MTRAIKTNVLMKALRGALLVALCLGLTSCEPPQVYGSVGYSSYGGGYGRPGIGTSIRVGGRIY